MNSIIIHLLGQRFPQVLYLFLCLFIVEILISRYSIRQEPCFFTHSLQIYCIWLIGLVSQSYWVWAPNSDPTIIISPLCIFPSRPRSKLKKYIYIKTHGFFFLISLSLSLSHTRTHTHTQIGVLPQRR